MMPVRKLGKVVSVRPVGPGVIISPGSRPSRFVFFSEQCADAEIGCFVSFTPQPPAPKKRFGIAVDVRVLPVPKDGDESR
jgi:hypothetical protein